MQVFLLCLILALFVHDAPQMRPAAPLGGAGLMLALLILPKVALALTYWLGCALTRARLQGQRAGRALKRVESLTMVSRAGLLALYQLDLWAGGLVWVRAMVGDRVLVDELLFLLPVLATLIFEWWAYYPIDRRLREAKLIRRLDDGLPVYPIWSRGQFVLAQLRHQMALLLVPLLLVLGWIETVVWLSDPARLGLSSASGMGLTLAGAAGVFVLAPLIIRYIWDTVPLPGGDMRDRLVRMCRLHQVRVRELLLWRTYGGMINAAVMGLIAPLRYILLSDALLEQVPRDQVEAVMAHELAHVRKRHMFWLLAAAGGTLGLIQAAGWGLARTGWLRAALATSAPAGGPRGEPRLAGPWEALLTSPEALVASLIALAAVGWFLIFGWVSRRFERQADAFAAVHLAQNREAPWVDPRGQVRVDAESAETMIAALQQVADLNNVPSEKKSWRHGSIAWRQEHLRSLIGAPIDRLPIDRVMRRIQLASLIAVALAVTFYAID
jgi:Zn-dependent protease with chaperone function